MYYCHTRYFVPEWGRWLNADNLGFLQFDSINGMNLFAYCANNPIMYNDPEGTRLKWWQRALAVLAIALVIVGTSIITGGASAIAAGMSGGLAVVGGGVVGGAAAVVAGAGAVVAGSAAVAAGVVAGGLVVESIFYASTERPHNNRDQNGQFRDAAREAGYDLKNSSDLDILNEAHRYIRKNKLNYGYKKLVEFLKSFLG